jgi:hypothetical protein
MWGDRSIFILGLWSGWYEVDIDVLLLLIPFIDVDPIFIGEKGMTMTSYGFLILIVVV